MQFHRANHSVLDFNFKLGDQTISSKTTLKDLGLILHNNLNWTNHYEHICSAAYRILGFLKRTFSSTSTVSVKRNYLFPLLITIIVLFSDMATCSDQRHPQTRNSTEKGNQVYYWKLNGLQKSPDKAWNNAFNVLSWNGRHHVSS